MCLGELQENARRYGRFSRAGIAHGVVMKNVGQIGLRRNYYDADFLAFRTRMRNRKKIPTLGFSAGSVLVLGVR